MSGLDDSTTTYKSAAMDHWFLADEHEVGVGDIVSLPRTRDEAERHERLFAEFHEEVFGVEHPIVFGGSRVYSTAFPSRR